MAGRRHGTGDRSALNASRQDDFILRQVAAVAAAIARILGSRGGGAVEEARSELDRAYAEFLGPRSELLREVDAATAAALIDAPDAIRALARLTAEEAEQEGDADRRATLRLRSVALEAEASRREARQRGDEPAA